MRGVFGVSKAEMGTHVFGESLLVDKDGEVTVGISSPLKSLSEEKIGSAHEVNFDALGEESFKSCFFFGGL